jgi:hypothetical protein
VEVLLKGERVVFRGRSCIVVGMDPVGITPRLVYLQDTRTNEKESVPAEEFLEQALTKRLRLIVGGKLDPRD